MKRGDLVKDVISGLEGVIIAYATYWFNTDRVGMRSREVIDGKSGEVEFFDIANLEVISENVVPVTPQNEIMFEYGDYVKDSITNFEGTIIGFIVWIGGCVRAIIQSKELVKGIPVEEVTLAQQQLLLIKEYKAPKSKKEEKEKEKPGGPMRDPGCSKKFR